MPDALASNSDSGGDALRPDTGTGGDDALARKLTDLEHSSADKMKPLYAQQERLNSQPNPTPPTPPQRAGQPPQQQIDPTGWIMAASLLGALGGAMGRRHVTNGLAAFTGALEGMKEGNQQKFENDAKTWEMQNKQTEQFFKDSMETYRAQLERKDLDARQIATAISIAARSKHDDYMSAVADEAAKQNDIGLIAAVVDGQQGAVAQFLSERDKLKQAYQYQQQKLGLQTREQDRKDRLTADSLISPEDAKLAAGVYLKTGSTDLMARFGRGAQGPQNNKLIVDALVEMGATPDQVAQAKAHQRALMSEASTTGTQVANLDLIVKNAQQAIPAALQASEALPRGKFVPLNKLWQEGQASISDPALKKFAVDNFQLAELWARAMNPKGVMRLEDRNQALEMLGTASSPEAYRVAVAELKNFLDRELSVSRGTMEGIGAPPKAADPYAGWSAGGGAAPAGAPTPAVQSGQPVKVNSPEEARKLPPGTKIILPDGRTGVVPGG